MNFLYPCNLFPFTALKKAIRRSVSDTELSIRTEGTIANYKAVAVKIEGKFSGEAVGIAIWNIALSKLQKTRINTCVYMYLHKVRGDKHIPPCMAIMPCG